MGHKLLGYIQQLSGASESVYHGLQGLGQVCRSTALQDIGQSGLRGLFVCPGGQGFWQGFWASVSRGYSALLVVRDEYKRVDRILRFHGQAYINIYIYIYKKYCNSFHFLFHCPYITPVYYYFTYFLGLFVGMSCHASLLFICQDRCEAGLTEKLRTSITYSK